MKKSTIKALIFMVVCLFGTLSPGFGQLLFNENFDYTAGTALTANGWTQTGTTATNPILVSSGGLTKTGYLSSGIGNAADLVTTGQDVNNIFAQQTTGSVYAGFLVSVASAQTGGDYFFHLTEAPLSSNFFKGRVFVKKDASNNLAFGISKSSTSTIAYTGFTYSLNTTYLLVVKYKFFEGTLNDSVSLYIEPVIGASEPTSPTVAYLDNTSADAANLNYVGLRQGSATTAASLRIDGIRIGQTWSDVTGSGTVTAPTTQTSNFVFTNISQFQMDISWTNGNGTNRILKINNTNSLTPPSDNTAYTANSVYSGSGEQVIYNGSGNTMTVTGLSTATTYYFQAWEYNGTGASTLYCFTTGSGNPASQATTAAPTPPVIGSPTATSIKAQSAVLGGNISATGGAPIIERGTVWKTSPGVTLSDNKEIEGGTSTGIFSHLRSGMPVNTTIYYAAYATNSAGTSLSTESSFTTLFGEPTNHAASFAAVSPTYQSIVTTWLDNDGAQPATGFLILANKTGIFTDPTDTVPVTNDPNLADGSGAMNIAHGLKTYTWTGLTSSTQYYFAIYAYTNSGNNINYKISPAAPTANVITQVFLAPVAAWTFDSTWAAPNTPPSWAANFGDQTGTAMLYADSTNGSSKWITATTGNELTMFGGATTNDPRETAFAGGAYSPVGGTLNSANGKCMTLKFSMSALQDPILTFATRGTSTGFNAHQWAWSTDGSNFTNFGTNTANNTSSWLTKTLDMSAIDALDGAPVVYLRITFTGASSSSGNNRLDNIVIRANPATTLPPTVFTTTANPVDVTTATLNGTVNANNQSTSVIFVYGLSTDYTDTIAAVPATVTGSVTTPVSAELTGLEMNTTYYYKVIGTNGSGTSSGSDLNFTTACQLPDDAGEITGTSVVCANGVTQYQFSVPPIYLATDYTWSFPGGTEILSGFGTNVVTVVFSPVDPTWDVSVFGVNICGDGNASAPFPITLNFPVAANVSVVASANPVAEGTMVTFTATPVNGGATPVYQWKVNGGAAGTNSPTYAYIPANNDNVTCVMTSSETCVTNNPATSNTIVMEVSGVPENLTVDGIVSSVMSVCYNATNTITVAGGTTTFTVETGGTALMIAGQKILYLPGTTVLLGGNMIGHIAPTGPFCTTPGLPAVAAGQEESGFIRMDNGFRIYPNPTSGVFTIEQIGDLVQENFRVEVISTMGGKILQSELPGLVKQQLSIQGNPPGVYFVKLSSGEKTQTVKIILTR